MIINNDKTALTIIFIMPETDDVRNQTPFQGFLLDLAIRNYSFILNRLLLLPQDIMEIFYSGDQLVEYRTARSQFNLYLLSPSAIESKPFLFELEFPVLAFHEEYEEYAAELCGKFSTLPISISNTKNTQLHFEDIKSAFCLDDLIYEMLIGYLNRIEDVEGLKYIKNLPRRDKKEITLSIDTRAHEITKPNEFLLKSLGFDFKSETLITPSTEPENYFEAILESSNEINKIVKSDKNLSKSDLILFSPSIFSSMYNLKQHFWNQLFREIKNKSVVDFIKNVLIKHPNYSGFTTEDPKLMETAKKSKLFIETYILRTEEKRLSTFAAGLLSKINNAPAIRLPNGINFYSKQFKDIESYSTRTDTKGKMLFKKKLLTILTEIRDLIGTDISNFIQTKSARVTVCSDSPLEWITFKDIPLMFTHEVSKINTTPGNLYLSQSSWSLNVEVTPKALQKILVIRSFKEGDQISNCLEKALNSFINNDKSNIDLTLIDVQNQKELISALNQYEGYIVIFDCHGNHGGNDSNGWLQIGDDKVDTWFLSKNTRIPPIIILSACLTTAISGSHASVANGFLQNGALSVIGTFLPVNANKSAIFISRIVLRISEFLDTLTKIGFEETTWRAFISAFFRMSYLTDILTELRDTYGIINDETYRRIHVDGNMFINMMQNDWFNKTLDLIHESSNVPTQELIRIVQEEIVIVETMFYNQMGRPETIKIKLQ
jgi:hypothetical protein